MTLPPILPRVLNRFYEFDFVVLMAFGDSAIIVLMVLLYECALS